LDFLLFFGLLLKDVVLVLLLPTLVGTIFTAWTEWKRRDAFSVPEGICLLLSPLPGAVWVGFRTFFLLGVITYVGVLTVGGFFLGSVLGTLLGRLLFRHLPRKHLYGVR
jgi:hypothetical protein